MVVISTTKEETGIPFEKTWDTHTWILSKRLGKLKDVLHHDALMCNTPHQVLFLLTRT